MPLKEVIQNINFECDNEKGKVKVKIEIGRNFENIPFNYFLTYNIT